jgi:hypothetical protein
MATKTFEIFQQAIDERSPVRCRYHGFERLVCPHVLGWKHGREQVLAFQSGGASESGLPPGGEWRCLVIEDVRDARLEAGDWTTSTDHAAAPSCVDEVAAEIRFWRG